MLTKNELSKATDQCVMCGLCLPHCPTYQISQYEAESPRGRISLVKAFVEGKLASSDKLEEHLLSCTGCFKCHHVCPANVDFQSIIDTGRYLYRDKQSPISRLRQAATIQATTHKWGHSAIRLASHIAKFLPAFSRHIKLLKYVSEHKTNSCEKQDNAEVMLFPGCTGNLFDQQAINSLIKLLDAMSVDTYIPEKIMCCGAIHQHSGLENHMHKKVADIKQYLSQQKTDTLLSIASGCGRQLNEYLADSSNKHFDALHWISTQERFNHVKFSAIPKRVLVHYPCTLDSNSQNIVYQLLKRLPDIELFEFNDGVSCCGAGGLQLTSPQSSNQRLIENKLQTIQAIRPDIIVSSNIGCKLNFLLGLEQDHLDIEVMHPLTLLAKQLVSSHHE